MTLEDKHTHAMQILSIMYKCMHIVQKIAQWIRPVADLYKIQEIKHNKSARINETDEMADGDAERTVAFGNFALPLAGG